jgi:hypothetical protein
MERHGALTSDLRLFKVATSGGNAASNWDSSDTTDLDGWSGM